MLLQKYEEDAQFAASMAQRSAQKSATDKNKQAFYEAKALYDFVSEAAGPNSPAKRAEKVRKIKAAEARAAEEVATFISNGKSTEEVADALIAATKGNSEVSGILKEARNNEDMSNVLKLAEKDEKLAVQLATQLLKAKKAEDVGDAFADAYVTSVKRSNPGDTEAAVIARQHATVKKYQVLLDLGFSAVKAKFDEDFKTAKTAADVQGVFANAGKGA